MDIATIVVLIAPAFIAGFAVGFCVRARISARRRRVARRELGGLAVPFKLINEKAPEPESSSALTRRDESAG